MLGAGVPPHYAGAAGAALGSIANQLLNGQNPFAPKNMVKTGVSAVLGACFGGVGAKISNVVGSSLATKIFTGAGSSAARNAANIWVDAAHVSLEATFNINEARGRQIDETNNFNPGP